ncbi:hypothetical protein DAEQUDRAFT_583055 [Daedalea quercina L-15889]|uniref:Uncharacterized protein n=1 Tax=Daedalea quercina L-15889 TaxID=1314783 RepID=A0A165LRQ7_9APHY|nr:hypothetical protein DAEQUDRAFT_583055 [Daedalea quercina L-15889]
MLLPESSTSRWDATKPLCSVNAASPQPEHAVLWLLLKMILGQLPTAREPARSCRRTSPRTSVTSFTMFSFAPTCLRHQQSAVPMCQMQFADPGRPTSTQGNAWNDTVCQATPNAFLNVHWLFTVGNDIYAPIGCQRRQSCESGDCLLER